MAEIPGPGHRPANGCGLIASKLDQWEVVFEHMDAEGLQIHVVTQEIENNKALGGANDVRRLLYYRELVARFAHHLAVIWNMGEENTNSVSERKAFASTFRKLDPYQHPITVHSEFNKPEQMYSSLYGNCCFEATSIQGQATQYNTWTILFRKRSADGGRPWAIYGDEQVPAVHSGMNNLDELRKNALWSNLMGGGAGIEWYFGYQGTFGDVQTEDFSQADPLLGRYSARARFLSYLSPVLADGT